MKKIEEAANQLNWKNSQAKHLKEKRERNMEEVNEFLRDMENIVKKIFPKSAVHADFQSNLGESIHLDWTLGNGKSEYPNGIVQNDPARTAFRIWEPLDSNGNLKEILVLELIVGGSVYINPPQGSYLAMDRHKVSFRKSKGDKAKILKAVEKYFKKLHGEIKNIQDDIYGVDRLTYKISSKL